jgi:hypothetical protein
MSDHYFGKYRGTVISNVDPLGLGRIQITVTDVAEAAPVSWAMPCFPSPGGAMCHGCVESDPAE